MLSGSDIRQMFIDFFEEKGHSHVPSSSLVPVDDPTLLFTNAGMNQFKDTFLGLEQRPYTRAVTAQKCVRAGGKHNDLDAVGRTARHHTFFEMMGNFSFGDYFKTDALAYAWELVTSPRWFGLAPDRLWVTIFREDEEAYAIWRGIGVPHQRIVRMGEKDNFWAMGDTGPCGPCSEIFIDWGEEHRCDAEVCSIATCGCDRWREFWNNVFMQYNRDATGKLTPLERPGVDTGLGLERMATILQGVYSNYDTDLLRGLIADVAKLSGVVYDPGPAGLPHRVIADHIRCCTFLAADGVRFSNEGRGYVMRRILRRAVRFGRSIGFRQPFLHQLVAKVAELMGDAYPEVRAEEARVAEAIRRDEERFFATLERGMDRLEQVIADLRSSGGTGIPGADAFLLYDTFGFPIDIVQDVALEQGLTVDQAGFAAAMAQQRERARAARDVSYTGEKLKSFADALTDLPPTEFVGYTALTATAPVVAVLSPDGEVTGAGAGDRCVVILAATPFYAESGGQVGDTGVMTALGLELAVEDTRKLPTGHYLHFVSAVSGFLEPGLSVQAAVDAERRRHIIKNHTATHLLQKALRLRLGTQVHQAGSLVAPDRLRFDFTHDGPVSPEALQAVEAEVNHRIGAALPVNWRMMPLDEARATGAMALFGEKYGDIVRVVSVDDYSRELCGGTHCQNASEIGLFKILSESGVAAGVRRIEACTGAGAYRHVREMETHLTRAATALKAGGLEEVPARVEAVTQELKSLEQEVAALRAKLARSVAEELLASARDVNGVRLLASQVPGMDTTELRQMTDFLRDKLGSGVVVLGTVQSGRVSLVAAATRDVVGKVHCGNLVKEVARLVGGSGGGRPDMAQAGGTAAGELESALAQVPEILHRQMK